MIYFVSDTVTIKRQRSTGGIGVAMSATFTSYQADIQPVEALRVQDLDGRIGKTYEAYVDATMPVKEADHLVQGTKTYAVKAVAVYQGAGMLDHKYLVLEAQD